jgi:hypothetical protein
MSLTVRHSLSMTTPDDPAFENRPSNWNADHVLLGAMVEGISAGTRSDSGVVVFGDSNGVSFGLNAGTLTASHNGLTSMSTAPGGIGAGTQTATSGTVVFANSNGLTFGMSGSSQLTASHNGLTTAALSNHSHGNPTLALTNLSGTTASNSAGLTLSLSAAAPGGGGGIAAAAGTQTATSGTVVFANSNGLTFGMSGSSQVTASHNGLTTAALSNHSHGNPTLALTNLSGTTASNSAGLTLSLSAAAPGGGGGVALAAGTQTATSGTVVFSNSNGVSFGMNGQTITATVTPGAAAGIAAAGAGTQTATSGSVVFANSNGITFGMSGSSQITASFSVRTASFYANLRDGLLNIQTVAPLQSTFYVFPFVLEAPVTAENMRMFSSPTIASTSFASTANTTISYNQAASFSWLLYSRNTGASSMSIASVSSGSQSLAYSINFAFGSASNTTHSMSFGYTGWDSAGASFSYSTSDTTSGSQIVIRSNNLTRLTGWKYIDMPINEDLSDGRYWLMFRHSTTATTQATNFSGARLVMPFLGQSQINSAVGDMAAVNAASQQPQLGVGSFTTVGGASTSALAFSNISSAASHVLPMVQFGVGLA